MPIALSLVIVLAAAPQVPEDRPCGFTVRPVTTAPRITGAPEVTGRTTVLTQTDSPLRVVAVDLTEATFGDAAGGVIRLEVGNVSDRTVRGGALDFTWQTAGYVTMSAVAVFSSALQPRESMMLDARLPGPKGATVTRTAVVVGVRSATFDDCVFEPAQPTAVVPGTVVHDMEDAGDACAFTAAPPREPVVFEGAPELLARVRVASQPASPLRIRRVDLSDLRVNVGEGWIQLRGSYTIEIENVSNVVVDRGAVQLVPRPGEALVTTLRPLLEKPLGPGKRTSLRQKIARIEDLPAGTAAADVLLVTMVDRVNFGWCRYHPARSYPKAGAR